MSTNNHQIDSFWMQQAIVLAQQAINCNEVPVGAIVVQDNNIIGMGHNRPITAMDPTAHAEIIALRQAALHLKNYRLPEVTVYVTLEPCAMCIGAMLHARIKRLVFGAYDPKTGAVTSILQLLDTSSLNHRIAYRGGILAADCGALLTKFFKNKR